MATTHLSRFGKYCIGGSDRPTKRIWWDWASTFEQHAKKCSQKLGLVGPMRSLRFLAAKTRTILWAFLQLLENLPSILYERFGAPGRKLSFLQPFLSCLPDLSIIGFWYGNPCWDFIPKQSDFPQMLETGTWKAELSCTFLHPLIFQSKCYCTASCWVRPMRLFKSAEWQTPLV